MKYILQGTKLVMRERRLWPYVWKPMILSALIFIAILGLGYILIVPRLADFGSQYLNAGISQAAALVVYGVLWWFIAGVIYLGISGVLSSLLWEKLSLEVERMVNAAAPNMVHPTPVVITDSLMRMMFSTCICCGSVCSVLFAPIGITLAAWLGLYDYTAPAFLRRGVTFPQQTTRAFRCKSWFTFALGCGLITLLPLVNVLLFPALVAGGTLMVADSGLDERSLPR